MPSQSVLIRPSMFSSSSLPPRMPPLPSRVLSRLLSRLLTLLSTLWFFTTRRRRCVGVIGVCVTYVLYVLERQLYTPLYPPHPHASDHDVIPRGGTPLKVGKLYQLLHPSSNRPSEVPFRCRRRVVWTASLSFLPLLPTPLPLLLPFRLLPSLLPLIRVACRAEGTK